MNAVLIHPDDTVLILIEPVKKGDKIAYKDGKGEIASLTAASDIPIYHKAARRNIVAGEFVIKYGQHIGRATADIAAGEHVHTQNLESAEEDRHV